MNFIQKSIFITFEGIEGSGKSYQSLRLYKYLIKKKFPDVLTREPGGTKSAEIIRNVIPYNYRQSLIQSGVYGKFLPFIQQESTFWKKELNELIDLDKLKKFKLAGDYYIWSSFSKKHKLEIIQTHLGGFKIHENQLSNMTLSGNLTYKKEVETFKKKSAWKIFFTSS